MGMAMAEATPHVDWCVPGGSKEGLFYLFGVCEKKDKLLPMQIPVVMGACRFVCGTH